MSQGKKYSKISMTNNEMNEFVYLGKKILKSFLIKSFKWYPFKTEEKKCLNKNLFKK